MDNQGPNNYNYNNGQGNNGSGGNGNNGGNRPGGNGGRNNRGGQGIMAFILLTLVALFVYALISNSISHASTQEKSYSDFIKQLDKGNVKSVEFDSYEIDYKLVDDGHKDYDITYYTGRVADDELVPTLKKAKTSEGKSIEIKAAIPDNTSTWIFNILSFIVPLILLWVLLAFVSKKMGGSMGMGVGKSTAKVYVEKSTGVNFKDVAGQDEAKESLQEVVDFSLIKNPGGGLAPIGGYIVGKKECVENAAYRLTSPGLGKEVGASLGVIQSFYQGFFLAPTVVSGALKGAIFAAKIYEKLGFKVVPDGTESRHDIIQAVEFNNRDAMIAFCEGIQAAAPVDSYVTPEPWAMPGYDSDVIMAAGAFVQGSSIELSADGPVKPPYAVYFQGGLTWYHAKLGILMSLQKLYERNLVKLD